ncbi:MAG: ABC transporter permease [Oscillospiraceae bacterium]|nr:ABC transporter permease [Oscillospiraceae bacterium]
MRTEHEVSEKKKHHGGHKDREHGRHGNHAEHRKLKRESQIVQIWKRMIKNRVSLVGCIMLAIIFLLVIFAPLLAPYDPNYMDTSALNAAPSAKHLFGADNLGRDILSRLLWGGRSSLLLGFICAIFGLLIGLFFGSIVGYAGKSVDMIVMRLCDVMSSIPGMLMAILISTVMGPGFFNTILAMTVGGIPNSIRGSRAMALKEREMEYLEAAKAMNCSKAKIIFKHMVPNIISPSIVGTTMMIGNSITGASSLSFVGLGIQPPDAEWGAMLSGAKNFMLQHPHEVLFPGLAILITVLATNMIGDGLRDALDPKLKN